MTASRPSYLSAEAIASLRLPGMPETARRVSAYAVQHGWRDVDGGARVRKGRGGGVEYHTSLLPLEAQRALLMAETQHSDDVVEQRLAAIEMVDRLWVAGSFKKEDAVKQAAQKAGVSGATVWRWIGKVRGLEPDQYRSALTPAVAENTLPAAPVEQRLDALPDAPTELTDAQRKVMTARVAVLEALDAMPFALPELVAEDAHLREIALCANGRGDALPSPSTIKRWRQYRSKGGDIALAPVPRSRGSDPKWLAPFWRYYGLPSKPSISWALSKMIEENPSAKHPTLRTVQRFVAGMGEVAKNRGRMGSRELRKYRPYRARSFDELEPLDVVSADGHTFDAEVLHPNTGRAFRPEIGTVVDIATRRIVGWSVDLAENKLMVASAMRRLCESGIPAIFYVDRGAGYKNQDIDHELVGMLARAGISKEHSLPYNAQAKGVIERINLSVWVRAAKGMPGYMGVDMDREARQKIHTLSRKAIRGDDDVKQPLVEWDVFMDFAAAEVAAYNARPHSSLPKARDPETGRKRNMSPDERWAQHLEGGWEPVQADPTVIDDLWRPYSLRTVQRGLVRIGNGAYFSKVLDHADMHGQQVQVGQDVHCMDRVWIRDMEGHLVCVAERDANKSAYFQQPIVDAAKTKRAAAQIKRLQHKEADLLANTHAGLETYEPVESAMPDVTPEIAARMARIGGAPAASVEPPKADVFEIPSDPAAKLRLWRALQQRVDGDEVLSEREDKFHRGFAQSADYRAAIRMENLFGKEKGPANGAS